MIDSGWMNIYLNRDALELKPPSGSESGQLASDWRREIDGPPIDDPTLLRATLVTEGTPPPPLAWLRLRNIFGSNRGCALSDVVSTRPKSNQRLRWRQARLRSTSRSRMSLSTWP